MGKRSNTKAKPEGPKTAGGATLTTNQVRVLDRAGALAVAKGRGAPAMRAEAGRLVRAVGAELQSEAEAASLRAHLQTTARLEAARTGDADAVSVPASGPVRVRTRDGLASLRDSGALTDLQVQAGLAYRLFFERAGLGLRSGLAERTGGAGNASLAGLQRAYMLTRLNQVERAVAAVDSGCELTALRMVAGEGHCVAAVAKGGAARKRCTEALGRALAVAAEALGLTGQAGGRMSTWTNPAPVAEGTAERMAEEALANRGS